MATRAEPVFTQSGDTGPQENAMLEGNAAENLNNLSTCSMSCITLQVIL